MSIIHCMLLGSQVWCIEWTSVGAKWDVWDILFLCLVINSPEGFFFVVI